MTQADNPKMKIASCALAALSLLAACGPNDTERAQALYDQAQAALDHGDYQLTLRLVDSIKSAYPGAIDVRRGCLFLSRRAIEGQAVADLSRADSLKVTLEARADSMKQNVRLALAEGDQVYLAAGANPRDALTATGLQGRVTPQGAFYIIASLSGRGFVPDALSLSRDGRTLDVSVPVDRDALSHRTGATEVMTLQGHEADTVGQFAASATGPMQVTYAGEGKTAIVQLPEAQARQLAQIYLFFQTMRQYRVAALESERLARVVQTARDQAARTYGE